MVQVGHVSQWIDSVALTGDDDGVDHGGSFSGLGRSDEQIVFLTDSGRSDGILDKVVVESGLPEQAMADQRTPLPPRPGKLSSEERN